MHTRLSLLSLQGIMLALCCADPI
ncbi:uncharacterized protein METZ01_LOCUS322370 [marine metagenome]|uniref:Uncharacterized protein n=1 Tax=marine metagenome TaxID=408172 RepID=A0A382P8D2_9ZZZZ